MNWTHPDPSKTSFPALVNARRAEMPDKIFIENDDGRTFTYDQFWMLSGRLATSLKAAGVGKGDRVVVQVDKSPEVIALFLACARIGAVFLPLNTAYTQAEVEYFVSDSEPRVIVTSPSRAAAYANLNVAKCPNVLSLGTRGDGSLMDIAKGYAAATDVPTTWSDLIAILYTSGTTGRSKGAMLTHANLASNALSLIDAWRFTASDTLLHPLPVYHTHGLFTATNTVLLSGGKMIFMSKFDADDVMRSLPRATSMMGVPTFYTRLLQHPGLTKDATAHMRLFVSGSAPLLAETHTEFRERTGHAILERYGMTETNMNTSNPYDGARIAGTVGKPLPGVEVRITDPDTGQPLNQGEIGMIQVRGPNVFAGYWQMPEKTAAEFRDGYFITGDLGQIDDKGYVSIVGRGKDLIITGGFNVYPKEIETELDQIDGIAESAVIGLPHRDFGEGVTAIVVPVKGQQPTEPDILTHLQSRLAKFKLPKRVLFVDDLPRNAMGKVQKALMRETYADLYR